MAEIKNSQERITAKMGAHQKEIKAQKNNNREEIKT
jgi:hypothetical protein